MRRMRLQGQAQLSLMRHTTRDGSRGGVNCSKLELDGFGDPAESATVDGRVGLELLLGHERSCCMIYSQSTFFFHI